MGGGHIVSISLHGNLSVQPSVGCSLPTGLYLLDMIGKNMQNSSGLSTVNIIYNAVTKYLVSYS